MEKRIGFIGAGQMAEALARGFIAKGICRAEHMFATDPVQERKEVFRSFKTNPVDGNIEVGAHNGSGGAATRSRLPPACQRSFVPAADVLDSVPPTHKHSEPRQQQAAELK